MQKDHDNYFIKTSEKPLVDLTPEQRSKLNRKGNELFNLGEIEKAQKIFTTTGYSDGLTRIGDYYMKKNDSLTALKFYLLAKNSNADYILNDIAQLIKVMIRNDEGV